MQVAGSASAAARGYWWAICTVRAAVQIHGQLLAKVLHLPVRFFDTTPSGALALESTYPPCEESAGGM